LTLRVKFIELIDSDIDPNTEKSLRDTIVPYVKVKLGLNIVENLLAFHIFNESIWFWNDFNFLIFMIYT